MSRSEPNVVTGLTHDDGKAVLAVSESSTVSRTGMTPELRLLLACLRPTLPADIESRLRSLLSGEIDWEYLWSMTKWHGGLAFLALHLTSRSEVPGEFRERLQEHALANAQRNLRISAELGRITRTLAEADVPTISYKGVMLSQYLYGSTALRQVSDIDLIIQPQHFETAAKLFEELGFTDQHGLNALQRAAMFEYWFEYGFTLSEIDVDVHWRVVQKYTWPSLSMKRVWKTLRTYKFFGSTFLIFAPELMLATLLVHAAQHAWGPLSCFVDAAELLRKHPDLNWSEFDSWFGDSHSRRSMLVGLQLLRANFDSQLPSEIVSRIERDVQVRKIADEIAGKVWPSATNPQPKHSDFSQWLFFTRGESVLDRSRYLLGVLFGPSLWDFQTFTFSRPFRWMYFLVRPIRIANKRWRPKRGGKAAKESSDGTE